MVKKFKSRYGDERTLTLLEDGSYRVEGRSLYSRHGDGLFDFEGGPCYIVGDRLLDVADDLVIESVKAEETSMRDHACCRITVKQHMKRKK